MEYETANVLLVLFAIVEKVTLDNIVPAVALEVLKSPASPSVPVACAVPNNTSARQLGGLLVRFVVVNVPTVSLPTVAVISEPNAVSAVDGAVVDVPTATALIEFVWLEKEPIFSSTQRRPAVTTVFRRMRSPTGSLLKAFLSWSSIHPRRWISSPNSAFVVVRFPFATRFSPCRNDTGKGLADHRIRRPSVIQLDLFGRVCRQT